MCNDSVLLERARCGDQSAFRELVQRHQERTYHLAFDLTREHHAAEDLSQEAFVRLYRSLNAFRGESALSSWLHRVTVNLYLDRCRLRWYRATDLRGSMEALAGAPLTDASDAALDLEAAMVSLSPRERAVFVLREYHGRSTAEIAGDLSIAQGTVKSLLHRALTKLRVALADYRTVGR